MGKELVVSSDRHETKVAILEDGQLVEIYFQRSNEYSLAGSIHKGRVTRVLPGMQSAFVDLGLERDTFLYVSDFLEDPGEDFDHAEERPVKPAIRRDAPPVEKPILAAPAPAVEPAAEGPAAPTENASREGRDRDRRFGRRRRRGRGNGGRFPDAKFASNSAPAAEPESEPAAESGNGHSEDAEPILLPGETLRKYQRPAAAQALAAAPVAAEPDEEAEPESEPGPPRLYTHVPEPDAPIHHPTFYEGELPVEAAVEVEASEVIEEVEEDEDEYPPAEAAQADDAAPEGDDEDVVIVDAADDEESGVEDDQSEETAAIEEQVGGEPAASAEVREPSMNRMLQDRSGRRGRRRGRGRGERGDRPERGGPNAGAEAKTEDRRPERTPLITDLLKEGQEILVQIAKEPLGQKGARITSHIALPGRYCVYMPTVEHTGVSRKIASDEERQRLKRILLTHKQGMSGGFIIRTAGEGKSETEIAADIHYLHNLWLDIRRKAEKAKAPAVVYHDLDLVERLLRDQLNEDFKAIWCDSEDRYESVLGTVQRMQPALVSRVKMYTRPTPILEAFTISNELEKALRPKVWLKSGGYIVINQTEALVAIDINTGKYIGKSNRLEDTIAKTNIEAVKEIVRQIRLRDLGGIIVIDFIDMDERKNRQKVMQALEEAMRADRAPYKILQFNDFGLVAITRKRVKQSLERTLCQPCPHCEGSGYIKSAQTIISEILAEAKKIAAAVEGRECLLRVNPDVAKVLKSTSNSYLEELEEILKRPVGVVADGLLHHEKFDLS
jgi:ribonuclease G